LALCKRIFLCVLYKRNTETKGVRDVAVTALVTGSLRTTWERYGEDKYLIESSVYDVLHAIYLEIVTATPGKSFFRCQADESFFGYDTLMSDNNRIRMLLGIFNSASGSERISYRTLKDDNAWP
jgi:hypothetical protein